MNECGALTETLAASDVCRSIMPGDQSCRRDCTIPAPHHVTVTIEHDARPNKDALTLTLAIERLYEKDGPVLLELRLSRPKLSVYRHAAEPSERIAARSAPHLPRVFMQYCIYGTCPRRVEFSVSARSALGLR